MADSTLTNFRLTAEDLRVFAKIQRLLKAQMGLGTVTRIDALRHALQADAAALEGAAQKGKR